VAGAGRFLLQPRIPGRHSAATIQFEWIPYKTSCGRINVTGQLWCRLWCELGVEAGAETFLLEPQILGIHSRSAIQFTFPFYEITGPTIKVTRKQHSREWCKLSVVAGAGRFLLQPPICGIHFSSTMQFEPIPYATVCGGIIITRQQRAREW